jgi:hypothetical protein
MSRTDYEINPLAESNCLIVIYQMLTKCSSFESDLKLQRNTMKED